MSQQGRRTEKNREHGRYDMHDLFETLRKFALVTKIDLIMESDRKEAADYPSVLPAGEDAADRESDERTAGKADTAWEAYGIRTLGGVPDDNPVAVSRDLRSRLREGALSSDHPYLLRDAFEVYYASIRAEEGICYIGPLSPVRMDRPSERRFYIHYGIDPEDVRSLRFFTLQEILYITELADQMLNGRTYEETELLSLNHLTKLDPDARNREQALYLLKEEDENEDDATWRHTYREERKLLDAVREGRTEDALRLSRIMDEDAGRLSTRDLSHWRNLAVVAITLVSRAAIEGGLSPQSAYRISGYYIQKCDVMTSVTTMLGTRDHAIRDLTDRVREKQARKPVSSYTENAKNYISLHYREKLRLEDIAEALGISPSYLSRLFRKDTGVLLQDYIVRVRVDRAANFLKYSDESLAVIAEYVGFPSQSYFGRVFKKEMNMTPKAYRDRFQAAEWQQG